MIVWISDSLTILGGASLTDKYWLETLPDVTHQYKDNADLYIVSNIDRVPPFILDKISKKRFIAIHHGTLAEFNRPEFYNKALLNIAMSPSHEKLLKEKYTNVTHFMPYIPRSYDRLNRGGGMGYVYWGALHEHKGVLETAKRHDYVCFIGDGPCKPELESLGHTVLPPMQPEKLLSILPNYEIFTWDLPRYGSFGRTLAEAHLAGMKVDTTTRDNFGIYSYAVNWNDPLHIRHFMEINRQQFTSRILDLL